MNSNFSYARKMYMCVRVGVCARLCANRICMTWVELLPECVCILATRQTQEQCSEQQLTEKDTKAMMDV